jgi:hypothetical protein
MLMLCQLASNSLCPSNKDEMPALPLQGRSFKNGVRFSVQTTSRGRVPCSNVRFELGSVWLYEPDGEKDNTGLIVLVESMKFNDAQNRPESAFVSVDQALFALRNPSAFLSPIRRNE